MIYLVAGPPCSGKTTWAHAHSDNVLDYDEVYAQVTGLPMYIHAPEHQAGVEAEFRHRLEQMVDGVIVRTAPRKQHRAILRRIHHAQSVVLAVPAPVCIARLEASDRPEQVKVEQAQAIARWWMEYEPSDSDTVLSSFAYTPTQS